MRGISKHAYGSGKLPMEEWLAARGTGIGASEIGKVVGLNHYRGGSAFDLYCQKLNLVAAQDETRPMRLGKRFEEGILREYEIETGKAVELVGLEIYRNKKFPIAFATPDAWCVDEDRLVECKMSASYGLWGEEETDSIPPLYITQVIWQLGVTGLPRADVVVLLGGRDLRIFHIEADEPFFEELYARAERFWRENIKKEHPPEPMRGLHAAEYLRSKYPTSDSPRRVATEAEVRMARTVKEVRQRVREMEIVLEGYENELKDSIGDAEGLEWEGGAATYRYRADSVKPDYPKVLDELLKRGVKEKLVDELCSTNTVIKRGTRALYVNLKKEREEAAND